MKNLSKALFSVLLIGGILAGCSSNEQSSAPEEKQEDPKPSNQKSKNEPGKDENGNYVLEEVGQVVKDDQGTAELLKIKKVNETVDINPIKVTIKNIKLIKSTNMQQYMAEDISDNLGRKIDPKKGLTYVQIQYTAENTSDKNIGWYDILNIVTDKGEQIDAQPHHFIYDDADSNDEFIGKVKKDYTDGYVLKDGDINKVKIIFGYSEDRNNNYNELTGEQTVEYGLN
ncbi:hypothetical protein [Priestia aryabhattai]|uniref:hypothetical protein n=1 Tax=Priestia aryabhattai TaxID=412384 RepID=UPI002108E9B4|nr:hypothetical protein [Priestia aryabhattai]